MARRGSLLHNIVKALVAGQRSATRQRTGPAKRKAFVSQEGGEPKGFPVGLVGESKYQDAIRACRVGEAVTLLREPGNPFDAKATVVICPRGQTIGYIARDNFLQRAIHEERQQVAATILSFRNGPGGHVGVVIDVDLLGPNENPIGERTYVR